ncbi:hypothetical protein V6Z11_D02G184800 [Gossypium hirsutum]
MNKECLVDTCDSMEFLYSQDVVQDDAASSISLVHVFTRGGPLSVALTSFSPLSNW